MCRNMTRTHLGVVPHGGNVCVVGRGAVPWYVGGSTPWRVVRGVAPCHALHWAVDHVYCDTQHVTRPLTADAGTSEE